MFDQQNKKSVYDINLKQMLTKNVIKIKQIWEDK